jgi:ornithine cyclodeaminase/alanine dehydrogenase-like protein (mu-crystallin family)
VCVCVCVCVDGATTHSTYTHTLHGSITLNQVTARADLVVCDSLAQCSSFGELSYAIASGMLATDSPRVREMGTCVKDPAVRRAETDDARVIVCDLTGIAAQDVAAATIVLNHVALGGAKAAL